MKNIDFWFSFFFLVSHLFEKHLQKIKIWKWRRTNWLIEYLFILCFDALFFSNFRKIILFYFILLFFIFFFFSTLQNKQTLTFSLYSLFFSFSINTIVWTRSRRENQTLYRIGKESFPNDSKQQTCDFECWWFQVRNHFDHSYKTGKE